MDDKKSTDEVNGHSTEVQKSTALNGALPTSLNDDSKERDLTFHIFKKWKLSISKPLIPLKLTLFLFYGAGSFMMPFIQVLFKERGVSLTELSTMTIIAPVFQFLGTTMAGVITDKIGKAKPVFVAYVLITLSVVLGMIFLPAKPSRGQNLTFSCDPTQPGVSRPTNLTAGLEDFNKGLKTCTGYNPSNSSHFNCSHISYDSNSLDLDALLNSSYSNVSAFKESWCHVSPNCSLSCVVLIPSDEISGLTIAYATLYVIFLTTFSSSYRCLDVTSMFMVTEHGSSFGHERFFGMLGNVIISPIAGCIADATSGGRRNYSSALYFFISLYVAMLSIVYKLPIKVRPPGEKMWKKSLSLSRNIDVLAFMFIMIVVGTASNFARSFLFWYLEGLNASSFLIGLITAVGALYGLPFLLTSKWWVKNIGATQIFVLACMGHAVFGVGYSLIQNPWYSLALEGVSILTYYLLWVAAVEYSHDLAPEGLTATVIALAGAGHFSVGRISAGFVGRFIMNSYGGRVAFRFCGVLNLTVGILYSVFLFIRTKFRKKTYLCSDLNTK